MHVCSRNVATNFTWNTERDNKKRKEEECLSKAFCFRSQPASKPGALLTRFSRSGTTYSMLQSRKPQCTVAPSRRREAVRHMQNNLRERKEKFSQPFIHTASLELRARGTPVKRKMLNIRLSHREAQEEILKNPGKVNRGISNK